MDGELQGREHEAAVGALLEDPQAQSEWHAYHCVGDVLRSEDLASGAQDFQFLAKLEKRLLHETKLALVEMPENVVVAPVAAKQQKSANADRFRWRLAAGGATTIAVAVLAVFTLDPSPWRPHSPLGVPMANSPQKLQDPVPNTSSIAVTPGGIIRDARVDQLVSAHQQLGGHSALQMPSGFLRNATYDAKGR